MEARCPDAAAGFEAVAVESPAAAHLRSDAGLQQALARTIQTILAPVVMVTACAIIL